MRKLIIILCISSFLVGCSNGSGNHNKVLEEVIATAIKEDNVVQVDLNRLVSFEWDEAHLFIPYTSETTINEKVGLMYKNSSNIEYRDDINLLVFVDEKKVVQYAEIPRKYGDLSATEKGLTPSNAVLQIKRHKSW